MVDKDRRTEREREEKLAESLRKQIRRQIMVLGYRELARVSILAGELASKGGAR